MRAVKDYRITVTSAAHDPLLARLYTYATGLVFHLLSRDHNDAPFWQRVKDLQPLRRDLATALAARDENAAVTAADRYSDGIYRLLETSEGMLDIRLKDEPDWRFSL